MYKEQFLRHLSLERRYSDHTIKAYSRDLDQFGLYTSIVYEEDDLLQVQQTYIRSWLVSLMDQELTATTIGRKLSTLKSFYKFLLRDGFVKSNPAFSLNAPKAAKRLPHFVDQAGMEKLFSDEMVYPEGFSGLRDKLMLTFFYEMGIRIAELIQIKDQDIHTETRQIRIIGKRNKERILPLGDSLVQEWEKFQLIRNEEFKSVSCSHSFVTDKGQKLYPKFVFRKVNHYLGEVSTIKKKSPHVLRHTFATHMLNNGADLNTIKTLLGHSSLAATQVYTHNSIEQLKNIHKQAHPRG